MTYWVRVENNQSVEVRDTDPAGLFPETYEWVEIPEALEQYVPWCYFTRADANSTLAPDLDDLKEKVRVFVRKTRWEAESREVTHGGRDFSVWREHRNLMGEYISHAQATSTLPAFKLLNGVWWTPANIDEVTGAYNAVLARVAELFAAEATAVSSINSATTAAEVMNAKATAETTFDLP